MIRSPVQIEWKKKKMGHYRSLIQKIQIKYIKIDN